MIVSASRPQGTVNQIVCYHATVAQSAERDIANVEAARAELASRSNLNNAGVGQIDGQRPSKPTRRVQCTSPAPWGYRLVAKTRPCHGHNRSSILRIPANLLRSVSRIDVPRQPTHWCRAIKVWYVHLAWTYTSASVVPVLRLYVAVAKQTRHEFPKLAIRRCKSYQQLHTRVAQAAEHKDDTLEVECASHSLGTNDEVAQQIMPCPPKAADVSATLTLVSSSILKD